MRSQKWQLALAASLGIAVAALISYSATSNAQNQTAAPSASQPAAARSSQEITKAICVVHPLGDSKVKGTVTFTKQAGGIEIVAELTGLDAGEHGFHVHEFGDCSMADGICAGGHFNPTGAPHGAPDAAARHIGDLGNIEADETGKATYKRVDKLIAFSGPNSIIGRGIIVHAGRDDLTTQPTGDAGGRIGCGVIGIADPNMAHAH